MFFLESCRFLFVHYRIDDFIDNQGRQQRDYVARDHVEGERRTIHEGEEGEHTRHHKHRHLGRLTTLPVYGRELVLRLLRLHRDELLQQNGTYRE